MSITANAMQTTTTTEATKQQQESSWEDMEYGTPLDLPAGLVFKNTFIACPNMRSASLDEFVEPRGWKSCPNSAIEQEPEDKSALSEIAEAVDSSASTASGDEEQEAETSSTSNPSEDDDDNDQELPEGLLVKNTFIDCPAVRSTSLDEYYQEKGWVSCPVSRMQSEVENAQASEIQQAVIAEALCESLLGNDSDAADEKEEDLPTLRLLELLPRPEPVFSLGSIPHSQGLLCKPCGFVHKPEGCSNAANCQYCHLCPPGTIKQRKKVKKVMVRQVRHQMHQMQQGWHY